MQDNGYSALAVPTSAPYDDFAGFVEYAKAHPGELNVGMPAAGSNTFLFGQLTSTLGIELNPVEMGSESDRLTNLAGGFIDIGVVGVGHGVEYETAGKLKVIYPGYMDYVTSLEKFNELSAKHLNAGFRKNVRYMISAFLVEDGYSIYNNEDAYVELMVSLAKARKTCLREMLHTEKD
jgi:hypothetical protein